jgi:hypothetical protein
MVIELLFRPTLKKKMLYLLHESHQGITKTKLRAKKLMFWPNMNNQIRVEQFIGKCNICAKFQPNNKKQELISHSVPNLSFEKIAADILTYQSRDYLVVVDYFSKWTELVSCFAGSSFRKVFVRDRN